MNSLPIRLEHDVAMIQSEPIALNEIPLQRRYKRDQIVNVLNAINFRSSYVTLAFRNLTNSELILIPAIPEIAANGTVTCRFDDQAQLPDVLTDLQFESLQIADGLRKIEVLATLSSLDSVSAVLALSETARDTSVRSIRRYPAADVAASINTQESAIDGELLDFNSNSFCAAFSLAAGSRLKVGLAVELELAYCQRVLFSGTCIVIRTESNGTTVQAICKQVLHSQPHNTENIRSIRRTLNPQPLISIRHPLLHRSLKLSARNLSTSGFNIEEAYSECTFFPGLLIPETRIELLPGIEIECTVQVRYCLRSNDQTASTGFAIVEISDQHRDRLLALIHQRPDQNTFVCPENLDLAALWDFFFESGFIYPEKYASLQDQKQQLHELYEKLYLNPPEFARHVIYQEQGTLHGHVAMFRYYSQTWIMHHHAARRSVQHKAGLVVMENILRYVYEYSNAYPQKMRYIACYFRPNNRFANRVFGGSAGAMGDRSKCSQDAFAYMHLATSDRVAEMPTEYRIEPSTDDDLELLASSYLKVSDGLMLKALDLLPGGRVHDEPINQDYRRHGIARSRSINTVFAYGKAVAIVVSNHSAPGLNLSDLTNCIQAFVIDPLYLTKQTLLASFRLLARSYEGNSVTAMIYPRSFADENAINYDKSYDLSILDLQYFVPYFNYIESLIGRKERSAADADRIIN